LFARPRADHSETVQAQARPVNALLLDSGERRARIGITASKRFRREKHMPNEWTEHKGFRYCVSPQAHFSGQQREWVYDVAVAIAGKETILYHGEARSAARAEASARKWIGGQSAGSKSGA
jgi:hypothetical protein